MSNLDNVTTYSGTITRAYTVPSAGCPGEKDLFVEFGEHGGKRLFKFDPLVDDVDPSDFVGLTEEQACDRWAVLA